MAAEGSHKHAKMHSINRDTVITLYGGHASDAIRDAVRSVRKLKSINDSEDEFGSESTFVDDAFHPLKIYEPPTTPKALAKAFFKKWTRASNLAVERPTAPLSFDSLECEACFLYDPGYEDEETRSQVTVRGSARAVLAANPRYDLTNLSHVYHQIEACAEGISRGGDSSERRYVCLLLALPRPNFKRARGYARERGTHDRLRETARSHILRMTSTSKSVSLRGRAYSFVARTLIPITDLAERSYDDSGLAYAIFGFVEAEQLMAGQSEKEI